MISTALSCAFITGEQVRQLAAFNIDLESRT